MIYIDGDMRFYGNRKPFKIKAKPKRPDNEFKVRHTYRNNVSQSNFKIAKKFWLDIDWAYKVKYENGNEHIYTEKHFKYLVSEGRFKRIQKELKDDDFRHFTEDELFKL
jgi:hypothetical protein